MAGGGIEGSLLVGLPPAPLDHLARIPGRPRVEDDLDLAPRLAGGPLGDGQEEVPVGVVGEACGDRLRRVRPFLCWAAVPAGSRYRTVTLAAPPSSVSVSPGRPPSGGTWAQPLLSAPSAS